ncbi:MAG TPA: hypothetical protein VMV49_12765 [Candidatus Deferrimicrobium sp.]|nr:hypothetical protein [Candidatus Deferrimicrobium sp.]
MGKDWDTEDWDSMEEDRQEGPFINEIILPTALYKAALRRGYQTHKEVGFYLIGLFKRGVCYVYDLIEFDYSEQSGGFIEGNMSRYIRLKAGLPLGLRIVGHMHKHPGFTQYSATDKQNFLRYGHANPLNAFLIYIVEPYEKISGYSATATKIFSVKVTIRDLRSEEALLEKDLKLEFKTKVMIPKDSTISDFNLIFSENINSESLKFLSRPTIQINDMPYNKTAIISTGSDLKVIPRKPIEIKDIGNNNSIHYRIFMEEEENLANVEKILKQLTYLPQKKGHEVIFYEAGHKLPKNTKIKNVNHPLTWSLEKSVLLPIFKNFHKFLAGIAEIFKEKEVQEIQPQITESDTKAVPQMSNLPTEKHELQPILKNFFTFLNVVIKILENETEKRQKKEVENQVSYEISDPSPEKKRRETDRNRLDYFI